MLHIAFQSGTLEIWADEAEQLPPAIAGLCKYDRRIQRWRAAAGDYAGIAGALYREKIPYDDQARAYNILNLTLASAKRPRDYQRDAVQAWEQSQRRGIITLPTGTGKSFVAQLCIVRAARSTLIAVPTLDLLAQWVLQLRHAFNCPIGALGGGEHDIQDITVSTYDSALLRMDQIGGRFGLLVFDECHHLPGPMYSQICRMAIAPWRLGLTATPERTDGLDREYPALIGPVCYRKEITDLDGDFLAQYETVQLEAELDADEQEDYNRCYARYVDFVHKNRINFSSYQGWNQFIRACTRQPDGRDALNAYLQQKRIARSSRAKIRLLWELLCAHRHDRIIVFTADNATAYHVGNLFALPVITHHTGTAERCAFLEAFRSGDYPVLVTSKVLNEGVDVPEASVGIILSGSGSVREHVQRLGRILRPSPGKTAVLYELVSAGTSERYTSERRRQHTAFES